MKTFIMFLKEIIVLRYFILKQLFFFQYVTRDAKKILDFYKATILWNTYVAIVRLALPSASERSMAIDTL